MTRPHSERGFTLVELMIVVVIVGILGALATYGVRRYIRSAEMSEAGAVITSIRGAEEVYKQDTFTYLSSGTSYDNAHPAGTPGAFKKAWSVATPTPESRAFQELGVQVDGAVSFTYAVVTGRAGDDVLAPPITANLNFPQPTTEPWYVIVAKGNLDGDNVFSYVVGHSFSGEVYVENEGE